MGRFLRILAVLICIGPSAALAVDQGVHLVKTVIPMPDGVNLAATLYMPADLKQGERVPALLEYLPYRKDDDQATEDYGHHAYFARHGYVGARVDIRGFGNSEGNVPPREYSAQEQEDGERVIAWLARQAWSDGKVGMLGISWGGFNAIQMAMRRPPALKAILATAATEALFTEDVHYMDGILHLDEFEVAMDLDQGRSGAPDFKLDEDTLSKRMDSPPWSLVYFQHQRDSAFWRAPVRQLEDIRIPCFLIGGLQDGYRNSIARMLERVPAPVHAWLGPWNHAWPNDSIYGPMVEWRDQAVRWFDHWLKGIDNGVDRDPRLLVYQQHSHPPGREAQDIPGEWRAEDWPPKGLSMRRWFLNADHELGERPAGPATDHLRYVPSAGAAAGFWWGELLGDQRPADAFSLVYESAPLAEPLAILGRAQATLHASASSPLADWVVRLEDVAPDGQVTAITGAGLNTDESGDKIPGLGLTTEQVDQIERFIAIRSPKRAEVVKQLNDTFGSIPGAADEIAVLEKISHNLDVAGYHDDRVVIDLSIARGLAYYNGPVFETILLDAPQFGSVFSGGRYDDLVMRFLGERVPATGASMGVDRLLAALRALNKVTLRKSTADVLLTTFDPTMKDDYTAMTFELRRAGLRTELYMGTDRAGKQIKYADKLEIPIVLLYGPDEKTKGVVTIKDMSVGRSRAQQLPGSRDQWLQERPGQFEVSREKLVEAIRELLVKIHG